MGGAGPLRQPLLHIDLPSPYIPQPSPGFCAVHLYRASAALYTREAATRPRTSFVYIQAVRLYRPTYSMREIVLGYITGASVYIPESPRSAPARSFIYRG